MISGKVPGFPAGPLVPDMVTAEAIYLAVERAQPRKPDTERYPLVDIEDVGDRWRVFRVSPQMRTPTGVTVTTMGGDELLLEIAKSDGALSPADYLR